MPTFTLELHEVVELTGGDIGLGEYPIFDEDYREALNQKIIDHYWNQEIGTETISMFRLAMRRRMNEVMPYYNQLYKSEQLNIDPLFTVDVSTVSSSTSSSEQSTQGENTTTTDAKSRAVSSEFPQNRLQGDMDYATGASDSVGETTSSGTANEATNLTGVNEATSRTSGTQGSQADMLQRFRQTFLNIDLLVISELTDLFMTVWNTSNDYTGRTFV